MRVAMVVVAVMAMACGSGCGAPEQERVPPSATPIDEAGVVLVVDDETHLRFTVPTGALTATTLRLGLVDAVGAVLGRSEAVLTSPRTEVLVELTAPFVSRADTARAIVVIDALNDNGDLVHTARVDLYRRLPGDDVRVRIAPTAIVGESFVLGVDSAPVGAAVATTERGVDDGSRARPGYHLCAQAAR